jgi:hypothetical protein
MAGAWANATAAQAKNIAAKSSRLRYRIEFLLKELADCRGGRRTIARTKAPVREPNVLRKLSADVDWLERKTLTGERLAALVGQGG